jgi:hypothetical protein
VDDERHDASPVTDPAGRTRSGGLVILGGGLAAVVVLLVLLVVSPASFVSLLPGWFAEGSTTAWLVAGLSALAAAILAIPPGRGDGLRGATITVLLLVAAGSGIYALKSGTTDEPPAPENTCVAYSGGRQTCPGG